MNSILYSQGKPCRFSDRLSLWNRVCFAAILKVKLLLFVLLLVQLYSSEYNWWYSQLCCGSKRRFVFLFLHQRNILLWSSALMWMISWETSTVTNTIQVTWNELDFWNCATSTTTIFSHLLYVNSITWALRSSKMQANYSLYHRELPPVQTL